MNLSIPTSKIVIIKTENDERGLPFEKTSENLILFWLAMKRHTNDRDKVTHLEQALRTSNETRLADIVVERHRLNMDLVPALFKEMWFRVWPNVIDRSMEDDLWLFGGRKFGFVVPVFLVLLALLFAFDGFYSLFCNCILVWDVAGLSICNIVCVCFDDVGKWWRHWH